MNERIRQLADEANKGLKNEYLNFDEGLMLYSEKFAQMIVAECLHLCESTAAGQDAEAIQEAIQRYFTVEE